MGSVHRTRQCSAFDGVGGLLLVYERHVECDIILRIFLYQHACSLDMVDGVITVSETRLFDLSLAVYKIQKTD